MEHYWDILCTSIFKLNRKGGVTPAMFTVVRNNLMLYSRVDLSHDRLIEELFREAYHSTNTNINTSRRQVGFNS